MFLFCLFLLAIIPSPLNAHPPKGVGTANDPNRSDEELISDMKKFMPKVMETLIKNQLFDFIKYAGKNAEKHIRENRNSGRDDFDKIPFELDLDKFCIEMPDINDKFKMEKDSTFEMIRKQLQIDYSFTFVNRPVVCEILRYIDFKIATLKDHRSWEKAEELRESKQINDEQMKHEIMTEMEKFYSTNSDGKNLMHTYLANPKIMVLNAAPGAPHARYYQPAANNSLAFYIMNKLSQVKHPQKEDHNTGHGLVPKDKHQ